VRCPNWPVIATLRSPDELLAVIDVGRVVACSPPAHRAGVRVGQRRKEAESLCEGLVVLTRDLTNEVRTFDYVVTALETFGVVVALREPGWAGFATRGPTRRLGGELALRAAVNDAVRAVLSAPPFRLGDGDSSLFGAPGQVMGARVGIGDGSFVSTLAAVTESVVEHDVTLEFLRAKPIEVLQQPKMTEVLRRLGIHTLGDFAALPVDDVLARFGSQGARCHELSRGEEATSPLGRVGTATYMREVRFDPPALVLDELTFVARSLAEELCSALADDGRACSLLLCEVAMSEGERLVRRWSHDGPWSAPLIVERLRWQLDAWLATPRARDEHEHDYPRGIERLGLVAEEVTTATGREVALWGRPSSDTERVERVLARVQGMLGPDAVQRPFLVGGRDPRERVRLVPFGEPPPLERRFADLPWPGRLPAPNPALLFSPPVTVELRTQTGDSFFIDGRGATNGVPEVLLVSGGQLKVTAWAGPWPLDEQWWQPGSARRRARLQVVVDGGVAYLLAQEHGRWLLEGRYD
jgi:protein ImuB